jgi:hypothetical protein
MPRRYHDLVCPVVTDGGPRIGGYGQVAVAPWYVGSAVVPQLTTHRGPTQLFTVQPVAGQVTWHSGLDPQSTSHDDDSSQPTWQRSPAAHPTSQGLPGWHWTSQLSPPGVQSWLQSWASEHTQ